MIVYRYDSRSSAFIRSEQALIDPLETRKQGSDKYLIPANCTTVEPPASVPNGKWAYWTGSSWEIRDKVDIEIPSFPSSGSGGSGSGAFPSFQQKKIGVLFATAYNHYDFSKYKSSTNSRDSQDADLIRNATSILRSGWVAQDIAPIKKVYAFKYEGKYYRGTYSPEGSRTIGEFGFKICDKDGNFACRLGWYFVDNGYFEQSELKISLQEQLGESSLSFNAEYPCDDNTKVEKGITECCLDLTNKRFTVWYKAEIIVDRDISDITEIPSDGMITEVGFDCNCRFSSEFVIATDRIGDVAVISTATTEVGDKSEFEGDQSEIIGKTGKATTGVSTNSAGAEQLYKFAEKSMSLYKPIAFCASVGVLGDNVTSVAPALKVKGETTYGGYKVASSENLTCVNTVYDNPSGISAEDIATIQAGVRVLGVDTNG